MASRCQLAIDDHWNFPVDTTVEERAQAHAAPTPPPPTPAKLAKTILHEWLAGSVLQGVKQQKINYEAHWIQTHKKFKRMLFIRTKHNMRIIQVIPFIKLQHDT